MGIDAMNWAAHVANHRSLTLWRLHALHHSQEDMSVLTTFRTHPLVHASYLPSLLPALILGASGTVPAVAIIVYGCLITLPHANLRWRFGPLRTRVRLSRLPPAAPRGRLPGRSGNRELRICAGLLGSTHPPGGLSRPLGRLPRRESPVDRCPLSRWDPRLARPG